MQAEGIIVSIIRRSLIVLLVREIESVSTPSAGRNDPRVIKLAGPRESVDVRDFIRSDRELSRSKARSIADRLLDLLNSLTVWTLTRRGNREFTPSDDAAGRLVFGLTQMDGSPPG